MMSDFESKIRVSLEVGSSKVVVIVGEVLSDGVVNVLGFGSSPSKGMKSGAVLDLDAVVKSIRRALDQAESMSDTQISAVTLAITGEHIRTQNRSTALPLTSGEVTRKDVENAMWQVKSTRCAENEHILHVLPQEFRVDNLPHTKNPIGLQGMTLYTQVHLITCAKDWLVNLQKAVFMAGIKKIPEIVFSGLASSDSVLTEEEKELGVCLVDIGGGTMDICVYTDGSLRYSRVYPFGGSDITERLVSSFGISRSEAERVKVKNGSAVPSQKNATDRCIDVVGLGGRAPCLLNQMTLAKEVNCCYVDLLGCVYAELQQCIYGLRQNGIKSDLIAGIVLTGGGSEVQDIVECAESVFAGAQVRVGVPSNITGLTDYICKPQYATAFGLLQYGYLNNEPEVHPDSKNAITEWVKKVWRWFV